MISRLAIMASLRLLSFVVLPAICLSQSTSTQYGASYASSAVTAVTVTSASTLAIAILPSSSNGGSNDTSGATSSAPSKSLLTSTTSSSASLKLPTTPYTGQSLLVGTCGIPQYTIVPFPLGSQLEVPMIGCSDDRPECCPSLSSGSITATYSTPTASSASYPSATGVISMLNDAPLAVCPSDFVEISPVCCPTGYSTYSQQVIGNIPCYSMLSSTISVPGAVLASISSAAATSTQSSASAAAATAATTVNVVVNQIWALGLPCVDDFKHQNPNSLSTGAKAGIGVGAGVGAVLLLVLAVFFFFRSRKHLKQKRRATQSEVAAKHISSGTATSGTAVSPSVSSTYYPGMSEQGFQSMHYPSGFQQGVPPVGLIQPASYPPGQSPAYYQYSPSRDQKPTEMSAQVPSEVEGSSVAPPHSMPSSPALGFSDGSNSERGAYETQKTRVA